MRICTRGGGIALLLGALSRTNVRRHFTPSSRYPHEPMPEPKLLDQVRQTARLKHFGLRTERVYAR